MKYVLSVFFLTATVLCGVPQTVFSDNYVLFSPDGRKEIRLEIGENMLYAVSYDGKPLVDPTVIGLTLADKGELTHDLEILSVKRNQLSGFRETPFSKKSKVDLSGNEIQIRFKNGLGLDLRAYDDGVAYRFVTNFADEIIVQNETGGIEFSGDFHGFFPYDHDAYQGDYFQGNWENEYVRIPVSQLDSKRLVYTPFTLEVPNGPVLAFSEVGQEDYPGINFMYPRHSGTKESRYMKAIFARVPKRVEPEGCQVRVREREKYIAKTQGTRSFPWRCFFLADSPAELLESDLVAKLAPSSRIEDVSWIRPGKAVWNWWDDMAIYGVDFAVDHNTDTYKTYIDFAGKHGLEYVLLDAGWAVYTSLFDVKPSIDLEELVRYAEARNVGIILWCPFSQVLGVEEKLFAFHAAKGIKGLKIDFFDRDDQILEQDLYRFAEIAARHRLVLLYHGMHKPGGLTLTWPNVMNCEGVFGLETNKFYPIDAMANDTIIPFVRMLSGPLDYTPGTMKNATKPQYRVNYHAPTSQGTRVHQMALGVLFESPVTVFADSPPSYEAEPECWEMMAGIPTVWDETCGIDGSIGHYVAIARKKGDEWFLAVITNWYQRELTIPLHFLGEGEYRLKSFRDGINANRTATDYRVEDQNVNRNESLTIRLAPGGGWLGRFSPEKPVVSAVRNKEQPE